MVELPKHKKFLQRCLNVFPEEYEKMDTSRMTLLFFVLSSMDVLDILDECVDSKRQRELIEWIYSMQISSSINDPSLCGFRGSHCNSRSDRSKVNIFDSGHLAMTYCALCSLLILGDDLTRVDRIGALRMVSACQQENGCFRCTPADNEMDMRFNYCALCICYILRDSSLINAPALESYIEQSLTYDFAFGQGPSVESHGGSTFCAVASLSLLDELQGSDSRKTIDSVLTPVRRQRLLRWCVNKQNVGFHGRPGKPDDSCYTYWISATLHLLDSLDLVDATSAISFTLACQDRSIGGFSKYEKNMPDVLHTYLSLAGLSLLGCSDVQPIHASLNISQRAFQHLQTLRLRQALHVDTVRLSMDKRGDDYIESCCAST